MLKFKNNHWEILIIIFIVVIGIFFRFKGISTDHSFWSDESYVSSVSRRIAENPNNFVNEINRIPYQRLQTASTAFFIKTLGAKESSARLPSVIWGTVGIIFVYLLAKKYSNTWGGILAALLFTFLELNLAYSTQAKPYAALETLFLMSLYYSEKNIILTLILAFIASLYNYIGVITFIPPIVQMLTKIKWRKIRPVYFFLAVILILSVSWFIHLDLILRAFIAPQYNWFTYIRDLFWRQFAFITLPAIFGLFLIRDKKVFWAIFITFILLLYSWAFVAYSHNIRYLMPVFGVLIVLFGVFWGCVGEILFRKPFLTCLLVWVFIYTGGYKIVRKPSVYYTPNADFIEDVQNADYQKFFSLWRDKYSDFERYPIFTGVFDSLAWYTNRFPTATFNKFTLKPTYHPEFNYTDFPNLSDFITQMKKYPQGFVMIHDWQSFMPDDIKDYVKKNLKFEFRVESMEVSPNDKWPLELYSWGFDTKN